MILRFEVACHVSTIPKSPPKIIRENTYTDFKEVSFFCLDFRLIIQKKLLSEIQHNTLQQFLFKKQINNTHQNKQGQLA